MFSSLTVKVIGGILLIGLGFVLSIIALELFVVARRSAAARRSVIARRHFARGSGSSGFGSGSSCGSSCGGGCGGGGCGGGG